jgi:hypothetical protein
MTTYSKHLIKHNDGSVSIMTTVNGATPESCIEKMHDDQKSSIHSHRLIHDSEIPQDRYFRNAWKHNKNNIHVCMSTAVEVHKENLRTLRFPKLKELDLMYNRAHEQNDSEKMNEIISKKNELRDVTIHPDVISPDSLDALKNAIPECLR